MKKNAIIFINGQPLTIQHESSGFRSIVSPYQTFSTLMETVNAVNALNGRSLTPLQHEGRLGHLPEGLPDLDNPEPVRIRKNILNMTQDERDLFINAIFSLKNNNNIILRSLYDDFVKVHIDIMNNPNWGGHGDALLPWHRLFVYHFESLLRAQPGFETVTVPYWDWTGISFEGELPFSDDFMGGLGGYAPEHPFGAVLDGPFAYTKGRWKIVPSSDDEPTALRRNTEGFYDYPFVGPTELEDALSSISYPEFFGKINGIHGLIHINIGGVMQGMGSPGDPIFWLHHGMVDKTWADWQDLNQGIPHYESTRPDNPIYPDTPLEPWLIDVTRNITPIDILNYRRLYTYE
ncbi:tyrosinase family protein [Chryseobacterium sp. MA9]|uniref:tyrosinase family protein n=1 Tax=Chryseobacterium sp. MA9 TaxID=2966625 RepID=UPI002106A5AA|nr:tyrosinase family protein [Chryseobacterium sp. MA9]UTX48880.1 tyrosinase family protein [Chryseobacterium sp. MA9]